MRTYKLIASALLGALAFVLQISNSFLGIPTGFGMTVDLAAVPILLAFFVHGAEFGAYSLLLLGLIILGTSPTGAIGAVMKVGATLPMVIIPYYALKSKTLKDYAVLAAAAMLVLLAFFYLSAQAFLLASYLAGLVPIAVLLALAYLITHVKEESTVDLSSPRLAVAVLLLAVIIRGIVATIANLYFAGPVFFHISPEDFIGLLQSIELPFIGGSGWWFLIFFWNAVQGAIEFGIAWMLAYRFGLARRYADVA